jgi:hypothetical protein
MTNVNRELLSFEAGEDLSIGNIVELNSDGEAIKCDSAEATDAIGMVWASADEGSMVNVLVRGVHPAVPVLVEDTDSSSGYDAAIAYGAHLVVSGKSSGTYGVGQALSASTGYGVSIADATTIVAKALEEVDGSISEDTYTTIKAYVNFM